MDFEKTKDEFLVRYYWWALEDFKREIYKGYPFLRAFKWKETSVVLKIMESLAENDRIAFSKALVKRFHKRALEITGEFLTSEEETMCNDYLVASRIQTPEEIEMCEREITGETIFKIDRKRFANLIKVEMEAIFGAKCKKMSDGVWQYASRVEGWELQTYINVGGRYHQLSYGQSLKIAPRFCLAEQISLLSWLGISGQTSWSYLTEKNVPETARVVAQLCEHFLQVAPKLLAGLSSTASE